MRMIETRAEIFRKRLAHSLMQYQKKKNRFFTVKEALVIIDKVLHHLSISEYEKESEEFVNADVLHEKTKEKFGAYYNTPGYFLWAYRQRSGLTQVELAQKAKITQGDISKIEKNKLSIGKRLAKRLAIILKIDYRKLL